MDEPNCVLTLFSLLQLDCYPNMFLIEGFRSFFQIVYNKTQLIHHFSTVFQSYFFHSHSLIIFIWKGGARTHKTTYVRREMLMDLLVRLNCKA